MEKKYKVIISIYEDENDQVGDSIFLFTVDCTVKNLYKKIAKKYNADWKEFSCDEVDPSRMLSDIEQGETLDVFFCNKDNNDFALFFTTDIQ